MQASGGYATFLDGGLGYAPLTDSKRTDWFFKPEAFNEPFGSVRASDFTKGGRSYRSLTNNQEVNDHG
jgi:hypothetical protein